MENIPSGLIIALCCFGWMLSTFLAWSLCRAAAMGDKMIEDLMKEFKDKGETR